MLASYLVVKLSNWRMRASYRISKTFFRTHDSKLIFYHLNYRISTPIFSILHKNSIFAWKTQIGDGFAATYTLLSIFSNGYAKMVVEGLSTPITCMHSCPFCILIWNHLSWEFRLVESFFFILLFTHSFVLGFFFFNIFSFCPNLAKSI